MHTRPQALPHSGDTLMHAAWPVGGAGGAAVDKAAVEQFEALKQLVRGVRNARIEYGLEQARKVRVAGVQLLPAERARVLARMVVVCHRVLDEGPQRACVCVCVAVQVAAVLVVSDASMRAALQQELPVICLLAKLDAAKV
jgi:valyl-tRNA synthetase